MRTRFAPSPTGDLHLGGAWTALASWVLGAGGFVLRVEDLDTPRVVSGAEARIADDLAWLGFTWDGAPRVAFRQSERHALYAAALANLTAQGLTYPCDCSRAEIARVASAPHPGEEVVYPGTCRDKEVDRAWKRDPATRLRVPLGEVIAIDDGVMGTFAQDLAKDVGDFVLRRGDGVFAYQLAVAVDDQAMAITDVVRGADLLASTPRQALLTRLLGGSVPRYWHLPLVTADDGERLAKRTRGATIRDLRAKGVAAEAIVGRLAGALGLRRTSDPCPASELVARAAGATIPWRRDPWPIPRDWAAL